MKRFFIWISCCFLLVFIFSCNKSKITSNTQKDVKKSAKESYWNEKEVENIEGIYVSTERSKAYKITRTKVIKGVYKSGTFTPGKPYLYKEYSGKDVYDGREIKYTQKAYNQDGHYYDIATDELIGRINRSRWYSDNPACNEYLNYCYYAKRGGLKPYVNPNIIIEGHNKDVCYWLRSDVYNRIIIWGYPGVYYDDRTDNAVKCFAMFFYDNCTRMALHEVGENRSVTIQYEDFYRV